MVSQTPEWEASPSRTASLLSLHRPPAAKTPPSYYDAVRSRHSLSQPLNKPPPDKQQQQQVKYNSLPRPLPQRYPPGTPNGTQVRNVWSDATNGHSTPRADPCPVRQQYDSPPKPANRVPLQLPPQHQRREPSRYPQPLDRPPGEGAPRPNDGCGSRRNLFQNAPVRTDPRPPPPAPGRRPPPPRAVPLTTEENGYHGHRNGLQNGLLRRCYPTSPNGSAAPGGYVPSPRPTSDGYEPRYSKSGKLCPRVPESKPMPPPVVMLRTGPLGTYPDAETLKRAEQAYSRQQQQARSQGLEQQLQQQVQQQPPQARGDVSQQIFVDTAPYTNGQSATTDHLAIPYRIPQVSSSPSKVNGSRPQGFDPVGGPRSLPLYPQPSGERAFRSRTLPGGPASRSSPPDRRSEPTSPYFEEQRAFEGRPVRPRSDLDFRTETPSYGSDVIYANQQLPFRGSDGKKDPQRSPPKASTGDPLYQNSSRSTPRGVPDPFLGRNPPRSLSDSCAENVYANHGVSSAFYDASSNGHRSSSPANFDDRRMKVPRGDRRNTHPPPQVSQKSLLLPRPPEMAPVAEAGRGWNGRAAGGPSAYAPQDVVKPTPRMPRLPNGLLSSAPSSTVPAYQCVINELATRPLHPGSPHTTDSSTLSLRSGYDSSSSSGRGEFGRKAGLSPEGGNEGSRRQNENGHKSSNGCHPLLSTSMSSLLSDTSSSVSRPRNEDNGWDRANEEYSKRKEKNLFMASPWDREEKEKMQQEQVLDARRARDQEIAYLESIPDRNEKQSEWLRILRLEREFQRRAEQELDDSSTSSDSDTEQVADFTRDKLTIIPNERMGLKLLDELLDNGPPRPPQLVTGQSSPSEKHFIPLDVSIREDDDDQPLSLPCSSSSNVLKMSSADQAKPPIPAPRPSKAVLATHLCDLQRAGVDLVLGPASYSGDLEGNASSLTKLDISDASAYFCSAEGEEEGVSRGTTPQGEWLIEVPTTFPSEEQGTAAESRPRQQDGADSRIYENIKPADYQFLRTQTIVSSNGYSSHSLPRSNSGSASCLSSSKETSASVARSASSSRTFEKKFPSMGVSGSLTKKSSSSNGGFSPSDADILPALYASSKVQNHQSCLAREVPPDLEDRTPEFRKMWVSRPEKLTFQDKIRKFSLQAGEDDPPRDRVKNSRAQREIEIKFQDAQKRAAAAAQKAAET